MDNMTYELLIRRAHQVDRYGNSCADADIWDGLRRYAYAAKEPNATTKEKEEYQKRLQKVKQCVVDALLAAAKRVEHQGNQCYPELTDLAERARNANDSDELGKIIDEAMQIFNRCSIAF